MAVHVFCLHIRALKKLCIAAAIVNLQNRSEFFSIAIPSITQPVLDIVVFGGSMHYFGKGAEESSMERIKLELGARGLGLPGRHSRREEK
jgi:hypothetical protein